VKDSTRKTLTNIINLLILVLNGIVAMLGTPTGQEVACTVSRVLIG